MCGIVGYVGGRQAYPILVKGLTRLEYRGYDSAGVALVNDNGDLVVYKTKGKVKDLERTAEGKDVSGTVGIAHTRWATHGEPSDVNSHPHYSENHELALIHNGIIENYQALKTELTRKGYHFRSQTDTEVVIQLIQYMMDSLGVSFDEAVPLALNNVVGAYALVIMDKREPDKIIAARKGSPLLIAGAGQDHRRPQGKPVADRRRGGRVFRGIGRVPDYRVHEQSGLSGRGADRLHPARS